MNTTETPPPANLRELTFLLPPEALPAEDARPLKLVNSAGVESLFGQVNQWVTKPFLTPSPHANACRNSIMSRSVKHPDNSVENRDT